MSTGPFDLSKTPIHLGSAADAAPIPGFSFDPSSFESYVADHTSPAAPGRLVMVESSPVTWTTWEMHPEGDEVVVVLEGRGEFIQQIDGEEQRIRVEPGSTLINPQGVWHTADVEAPIRALYITPCPGTTHKER